MPLPTRQTRSTLMQLFQERGWHPRGDLGQNFLIDLNLLELVVQTGKIVPGDVILEVGAGTGGMTAFLAAYARHVVSVEYDPRMYELAKLSTADFDNVTLLNVDALANKNHLNPVVLDALDAALVGGRPLKLIANLPYHVGTPVISNLVASDYPWTRMVVTVQWELAERMLAAPGTHDYSALTIWLQSQCRLEVIRKLPPTVFWPRPKVDSAIVLIEPDEDGAARMLDRKAFQELIRELFTHRRKLLRPALCHARRDLEKPAIDAILATLQVPSDARAEQLTPEQLIELCNALPPREPTA